MTDDKDARIAALETENARLRGALLTEQPKGQTMDIETCPDCKGSGSSGHPDSGYGCYKCEGTGGIPSPAPKPADDVRERVARAICTAQAGPLRGEDLDPENSEGDKLRMAYFLRLADAALSALPARVSVAEAARVLLDMFEDPDNSEPMPCGPQKLYNAMSKDHAESIEISGHHDWPALLVVALEMLSGRDEEARARVSAEGGEA